MSSPTSSSSALPRQYLPLSDEPTESPPEQKKAPMSEKKGSGKKTWENHVEIFANSAKINLDNKEEVFVFYADSCWKVLNPSDNSFFNPSKRQWLTINALFEDWKMLTPPVSEKCITAIRGRVTKRDLGASSDRFHLYSFNRENGEPNLKKILKPMTLIPFFATTTQKDKPKPTENKTTLSGKWKDRVEAYAEQKEINYKSKQNVSLVYQGHNWSILNHTPLSTKWQTITSKFNDWKSIKPEVSDKCQSAILDRVKIQLDESNDRFHLYLLDRSTGNEMFKGTCQMLFFS